jgi:hypothetical protein
LSDVWEFGRQRDILFYFVQALPEFVRKKERERASCAFPDWNNAETEQKSF